MQGSELYDVPYVVSVFDPFSGGAKIPESFARPTALFSHKYTGVITSSTQNGQFYLSFNPLNFMKSSNKILLGFTDGATNKVNLESPAASTTSWSNGGLVEVNSIVGTDYTGKFTHGRLVSAGLKIMYYGRMDERAGVLMASMLNEELPYSTGNNSLSSMQDGHFFYQGPAEDGLYLSYLPYSRKTLDLKKIGLDPDVDNNTISWSIVGYGLPKGVAILRYEIVLNCEGVVDHEFTDYVASTKYNSDLGEETYAMVSKLATSSPKLVVSELNSDVNIQQLVQNDQGRRPRRSVNTGSLPGFRY